MNNVYTVTEKRLLYQYGLCLYIHLSTVYLSINICTLVNGKFSKAKKIEAGD